MKSLQPGSARGLPLAWKSLQPGSARGLPLAWESLQPGSARGLPLAWESLQPGSARGLPLAWNARASAVLAALVLAGCGGDRPWFVEEAGERGIDFRHESGFDGTPMLPDIVGGGAALVDVDGDGDLDAYLVQSGRLPARGEQPAPGNRLYLNRGDGTFAEATDIGDGADAGYGMGVAAGDYDNDGDVDLYVTNTGPNALLRNDGDGRFVNVAPSARVADPGWGSAAAFLDLDADGDLDLFVVNYINWSPALERDCYYRGAPTYCAPTTYAAPAPDKLFRNNGDGTFTDVSVEAGLAAAYGNGLGIVGADFDRDGRLDVFVANDRNVNQLWMNQGGLRFRDLAADWGSAVDEHGVAKAGMGVAAADVDDDGDSDLLVVNFEGETDSFFRNEGAWFSDQTAAVGLGAISGRHTRFGVALSDFDNDGVLDLYEANGKVDGDPSAVPDPFAEPNVLYRGQAHGAYRLEAMGSGVAEPLVHTSRGVAIGDVDDDGGPRHARGQSRRSHVPVDESCGARQLGALPGADPSTGARRARRDGVGERRGPARASRRAAGGQLLRVQRPARPLRSRRPCGGHGRRRTLLRWRRAGVWRLLGRQDMGTAQASVTGCRAQLCCLRRVGFAPRGERLRVRFVDASGESGIDFTHLSGIVGELWTLEIIGAGVGVLDYDGDGRMDVWLVQGGPIVRARDQRRAAERPVVSERGRSRRTRLSRMLPRRRA